MRNLIHFGKMKDLFWQFDKIEKDNIYKEKSNKGIVF